MLGDLFEWVPAADLHISCKKAGSLEEQQTAAPDRLLGATHAYVVGGHNVGAHGKPYLGQQNLARVKPTSKVA